MGKTTPSDHIKVRSRSSNDLGETQALLRKIESMAGIGHWEVDLVTEKAAWSDQFFHILGLDPAATVASTAFSMAMIHPEDRERASAAYQLSSETGSPFKVEKRIIRPSGEVRFVISEGIVDLDEEGKPVRVFGIFKDITKEKLKEEELNRTNVHLENILNTTQDLVIIAEEDGPFLRISKSCEKILGYKPEELVGKSFRNMIHPDDFQATLENRNEVLAGIPSSNFRNRYFKKDGSVITLSWSSSFDSSTKTVFGIARDITQLLLTQENLRVDRQKLSIVLNASPETIWAFDRNYCLITANNNFLKTMKEIGNWELNHGDNLIYDTPLPDDFTQEWQQYYDRALAGETFSIVRKITLVKAGGYMEVNFKPIYNEHELVAVGCYSLNITRQIEDEQRTKELLDRLNLAQKIGKLGYWEFSLETGKIYWSDEVYTIWGAEKHEIEPDFESFIETIHPEDRKEYLQHHNNAIKGIAPLDAGHRIILPSGDIKYVHEKGELEIDPKTGKKTFRGTVQDITVEKTFEKELIERNQFIESALHHLPTGLAVNKVDTGEATFINPAFAEVYGWPTEVIKDVATFFNKIYPEPEFRAQITKQILDDISSGDAKRMSWKNIPIVTQTGEKRIVSAKNIPLPDQNLMISTVVDETDNFWADHSLRISNDRFHLATQAVSDAIWDWDLAKNSIFWGNGYHRLFGYPADLEYVSPELWKEKIHPEDFPYIWDSIQKTRNDKSKTKWSGEYRFQMFDGTYTFVKENVIIIRDEKGNPIRMVGSLKDISEEKEKELQLLKKTNLIAGISHITQLFFEEENWLCLIQPVLKMMGEISGVDRAYFFKNFKDPATGVLYTQQVHEWTNGQVSSEIENPDYQAIPLEDHPVTLNEITKGKPFFTQTSKAEEPLKEILVAQNIKSILLMPIIVNDYFLGFIGFDDCTTERVWTEDEISFLASVTTNLSLAIDRKKNLDKIREAFESRDSLLESIGDSFYALDTNYTVTYWNNVVEKLTGVKRESIVGRSIWEFVGIENDQFKSAYELVFKENKIQYFETYDPWVKAWLEVTIYPSSGGLSVIIKDITKRKDSENQIKEFNERFRLISYASHDAIWDWNIQTGEHYWGEGFNTLFGEEISGTHNNYNRWRDGIHPEDRDRVITLFAETIESPEHTIFEAEYRFLNKTGQIKHLLDKGIIIRNEFGIATRVVGAIQDITSRKSYEESLKNLNTELAEINSKLEASNQELEQFAYVASHDLQEPLRMISSFLGLIERKYAGLLDEKGLQYIHFAVDGARRMKEIILDLLEFSRLGSMLGDKTTVKTHDLIQEVLLLNGKSIREKKAIIHIGTLPDITCHSSQIIQVFQNLISNGLKYQPIDNIPELWIEGEEMETEWKFSVRDNGIGIDPDYREKVFIIFQRLHIKEQYSGSGIGLSLCKKIVEFHGGKIWLESTPGEGSIFYFTLKK